MSDDPEGTELLAIAHSTLAALVPSLPDAVRLDGLMVANALAVALRDLRDGPVRAAALKAALEALYGASGDHAGRLAADLRHGRLAPEQARRAWEILVRDAAARVAASNPRHLKAR